MSVNSLTDLINETAWQQARDAQAAREASVKPDSRNVGTTMGKHDFLMLLAAQLRHQDPLNPQSDAEFASQLAQFSSLEQMQNLNETINTMQAYSMVGKFVVAEASIDGLRTEIIGTVDSVFTMNGITYAQVGEYSVPIHSIKEVFDGSGLLTPDLFLQTSNNLIGRTVKAELADKTTVEGIVTRITVDGGLMYARIEDETGAAIFVEVGRIFDIRETGTPGDDMPGKKPSMPDIEVGHLLKPDGDGFAELNTQGEKLGRWDWNAVENKWIFTAIPNEDPGEEGEGTSEPGEPGEPGDYATTP